MEISEIESLNILVFSNHFYNQQALHLGSANKVGEGLLNSGPLLVELRITLTIPIQEAS